MDEKNPNLTVAKPSEGGGGGGIRRYITRHPRLLRRLLIYGCGLALALWILRILRHKAKSGDTDTEDEKILKNKSLIRKIGNSLWVPTFKTHFTYNGNLPQTEIGDSSSSSMFFGSIKPWHYAQIDEDNKKHFEHGHDYDFLEDEDDEEIPDELLLVLQCMRVLGFFEKKSMLTIWKSSELVHVKEGEFLFKAGDPDDQIYIVHSGSIEITIKETNRSVTLKRANSGDQIFSLISFLEVLTRSFKPLKLVDAQALVDSTVIRISVKSFRDFWSGKPEIFKISILKILRRIYGTYLKALHKVLGLGTDLMKFTMPQGQLPDPHIGDDVTPEIKNAAIGSFMKALGTEDKSYFVDCDVRIFDPNENIYFNGKSANKLFYNYDGYLISYVPAEDPSKDFAKGEQVMAIIPPKKIFGAISFFCDEIYIISCKSATKSIIVTLEGKKLKGLLKQYPEMIISLAASMTASISPLVRQLAYGIEWVYLASGKTLYSAGSNPDATYICLLGRLKSVGQSSTADNYNLTLAEYGQNDWVGMIDVITKQPRPNTIIAARDTQLAKLPNDLLNYLKNKFPVVSIRLLNYLGEHAAKDYKSGEHLQSSIKGDHNIVESIENMSKPCSAVAFLPVNDNVPAVEFINHLERHFHPYGSVYFLTLEKARLKFGFTGNLTKDYEGLLSSWFSRLEEKYSLVIYLATCEFSLWNLKCLRQTDTIFVLAGFTDKKKVTEAEKMMINYIPRVRKELILIHRKIKIGNRWTFKYLPKNTKLWLQPRKWLSFHHHIRMEMGALDLHPPEEDDEEHRPVDAHNDFSRLARWISRTSTGLVLGGGGAKGAAHIGFLEILMKEKKVPIDMVCGVSIGSFVGALIALYGTNFEMIESETKAWFKKMCEWWRYLLDFTTPIVSLFRGESFNTTIREAFEEIQIEDLWIPYFCVSTDIKDRHWRVHRFGTLWRYARASMNLAVLLHYLMDGGYSNIVPADLMRQFGANYIIAIDIGSAYIPVPDIHTPESELKKLQKKFPFLPVGCSAVPSIIDTHQKLTFVQSSLHLTLMKKYDTATIFLRPNINDYTSTNFSLYDDIREEGYKVGKELLKETEPGDPIALTWVKMRKIKREDVDDLL